jgi:hypothetical protein
MLRAAPLPSAPPLLLLRLMRFRAWLPVFVLSPGIAAFALIPRQAIAASSRKQ